MLPTTLHFFMTHEFLLLCAFDDSSLRPSSFFAENLSNMIPDRLYSMYHYRYASLPIILPFFLSCYLSSYHATSPYHVTSLPIILPLFLSYL